MWRAYGRAINDLRPAVDRPGEARHRWARALVSTLKITHGMVGLRVAGPGQARPGKTRALVRIEEHHERDDHLSIQHR